MLIMYLGLNLLEICGKSMTRELKSDFKEFESYISKPLNNNKAITNDFLKPIHKWIFSFLVYIHLINDDVNFMNEEGKKFINEALSDVIQSIHCLVYGLVKPAELLLRSSIENFIRSIASQEAPELISEKSIYLLFDKARTNQIFSSNLTYFDSLRSIYGNLCGFTHSSLDKHFNINSFNQIQRISKKDVVSYQKELDQIITSYLFLLIKYNFVFFESIYFKNKNIILDSLKAKTKKELFLVN